MVTTAIIASNVPPEPTTMLCGAPASSSPLLPTSDCEDDGVPVVTDLEERSECANAGPVMSRLGGFKVLLNS